MVCLPSIGQGRNFACVMTPLPGDPNFDVNWASQNKDEETLNRARLEYNSKGQQEGDYMFILFPAIMIFLGLIASGTFRPKERNVHQRPWSEPSQKGKSKGLCSYQPPLVCDFHVHYFVLLQVTPKEKGKVRASVITGMDMASTQAKDQSRDRGESMS